MFLLWVSLEVYQSHRKKETEYFSALGNCANPGYHHPDEITPPPEISPPLIDNDLLVTYVLPTLIIFVMLLIALLLTCYIYRKRRNTGKMELGDEEERKSFRSKGIPVIFQGEINMKVCLSEHYNISLFSDLQTSWKRNLKSAPNHQ